MSHSDTLNQRAARSALACLILYISVLVLIPLTIQATNAAEFSVGFLNGLSRLAPWILLCLAFNILVCTLAPNRIYRPLAAVLVALNILVYVQAYVINWNYGLLDGTAIEWNELRWRGALDLGLWLLLLTVAFYYSNFFYRNFFKILAFIAVLQISNALLAFQSKSLVLSSEQTLRDVAPIYEFSSTKNVVQIVLDAFEAPAFEYLIKNNDALKVQFKDFTFFQNTISSFPTTAASIPSILSSKVYDNQSPIKEFLQRALPESLPSLLHKNSFSTSLVTLSHYCNYISATACLPLDQVNERDFAAVERKHMFQLIDLALFKSVPHFIKPLIYNDQNWLLQNYFQKRKGPPSHVNSIEFINSVLTHAKVTTDKPVYKFYHLLIPHTPLALDENCNYTKKYSRLTPQNYAKQAACALKLAGQITQKVEQLGISDKTMIIISADHGVRLNFGHYKKKTGELEIAKALPILLIKNFSSKEAFSVSQAPAMLIDIPKTISTALNLAADFDGESLLSLPEDAKRRRIFHNYSWKHEYWDKDFLPPISEFAVEGNAWDIASWQRSNALTSKDD